MQDNCKRFRDEKFGDLKIGDYFQEVGTITVLRQVVIYGVYRRSIPVGRWYNHRVTMVVPEGTSMTPKDHGSTTLVHKVVLL